MNYLPYAFDLIYDIKDRVQLENELNGFIGKVIGIIDLMEECDIEFTKIELDKIKCLKSTLSTVK